MGIAASAIQHLEFYGFIFVFSLIGVVGLLEWTERNWRLPRDRWFRSTAPPKAIDPAHQAKVEVVTADAVKDRAKVRDEEQFDLATAKEEWRKRATDYSV